LEIRFHKRKASFLVIKTVKCKGGINYSPEICRVTSPSYDRYIKI